MLLTLEECTPKLTIIREINKKFRKGRRRYSADIAQRKADEKSSKQGRKTKFQHEPTKQYVIEISTLGRGLSTGSELEYADKNTIDNALKHRVNDEDNWII